MLVAERHRVREVLQGCGARLDDACAHLYVQATLVDQLTGLEDIVQHVLVAGEIRYHPFASALPRPWVADSMLQLVTLPRSMPSSVWVLLSEISRVIADVPLESI